MHSHPTCGVRRAMRAAIRGSISRNEPQPAVRPMSISNARRQPGPRATRTSTADTSPPRTLRPRRSRSGGSSGCGGPSHPHAAARRARASGSSAAKSVAAARSVSMTEDVRGASRGRHRMNAARAEKGGARQSRLAVTGSYRAGHDRPLPGMLGFDPGCYGWPTETLRFASASDGPRPSAPRGKTTRDR
jgi:hypothetical protein